jgi:hypothetical protein
MFFIRGYQIVVIPGITVRRILTVERLNVLIQQVIELDLNFGQTELIPLFRITVIAIATLPPLAA